MTAVYSLILLSVAIGIAIIFYLRSLSLHSREPLWVMGAATVVGAIVSVVVTLGLYAMLEEQGVRAAENALAALLIIGPVEEFGKLFGYLVVLRLFRRYCTEPVHALIYMSCVALGFSVVENFLYALSPGETHLILLRVPFATPAHIFFSSFLAMPFAATSGNMPGLKSMARGWIFAAVAHGVYDAIVFETWAGILFLPFYVWFLRRLRARFAYLALLSPRRKTLLEWVRSYAKPKRSPGIECLRCGNQEEKATFKLRKISVQLCPQCGAYVCQRDSIFYIFGHFAGYTEDMSASYTTRPGKKAPGCPSDLRTLFRANYFCDERRIGYFRLSRLNAVLERHARINRIEGADRLI